MNLCNQWSPKGIRMHQIRFAPGLSPGPRWGSSRRFPIPPSRMGRGKPPPHTSPPSTPSASRSRRLWRLGLDAFGVSVPAPVPLPPTYFSFPRACMVQYSHRWTQICQIWYRNPLWEGKASMGGRSPVLPTADHFVGLCRFRGPSTSFY